MSITKNQAQDLWADLRGHLLGAEKAIKEIIATKAWEPMGYSTFAEAWTEHMSGITIATEIRAHVVYQMLSEGMTSFDVACNVKGVGPTQASALDDQRRDGIPADHASVYVRPHDRTKPTKRGVLHIEVGDTLLTEYKRISKRHGLDVDEVAKEGIRQVFADLSRKSIKRSA